MLADVGTAWHFYLLGEMEIVHAGDPITPPPPRAYPLLAALLLSPVARRRDRLVGMLFPDGPERSGRRRLSDLLWLLRRSLTGLPLVADATWIEIPAEARWLDVEAFRQAAARPDLEKWETALDLYRGDLLPTCFDDWLLLEREALRLQYVNLLHRACKWLAERGEFGRALPLARRLVGKEPYDEETLRLLMRTHAALGQRGAALATYEHFVNLAADELGIEPDSATESLAHAIRAALSPPLELASPLPASDSPDKWLRRARAGLERGDRATVEVCLHHLRTLPVAEETPVRLLEIDLALYREDYAEGERLLAACDQEEAAVVVRQATLALAQGRDAVAHEAASRALLLAHDAQRPADELEALLALTHVQRRLGQGSRALATAEQALILAQRCASPAGVVRARLAQGQVLYRQGRLREALPLYHEAQSLAHEHGLRRHLAKALHGLANARSEMGSHLESLDMYQQALGLWRDMGLLREEARTLQCISSVYDLLGRGAEALRTLKRARQICEQAGDPLGVARCQYHLAAGIPYHDEKKVPRAIALAGESLATFRAYEQPGWEAATLAVLGYAHWIAEQHKAALDAFRQAHDLYQRLGEMGLMPELLAYQGLAHLGMGNLADALDCTRRALVALAQGYVSGDISSEIYYAHAVVLAACGHQDQAHAYFARAYHNLLECAALLEEESARQAFFRRDPTVRRLMAKVYARGIAPAPEADTIRWLPPRTDPGWPPVPVRWTLDAGPPDVALKRAKGAVALRRSRLARILSQAEGQGARPTVRQLAVALGVSPRTIKRDLAALRKRET